MTTLLLGLTLGIPIGFALALALNLRMLRNVRLRLGELEQALGLVKSELRKLHR